MKRIASIVVLVLASVLPAAADAHVELEPNRAPAASEKRLVLVVENERHEARTEKVDVQLPAGLASVSSRPPQGWSRRVRGRRLVYTARSDSAKIAGDHVAKRFAFRALLPDRPRSTLTFKVLQTYDNGEVVRWIGARDSEEPAARLRLTAAKRKPQGTTEPDAGTTVEQPATTQGDESGDGDGGNGLTIALLIAVGAAGIGSLLWLRLRRRRH